MRVEGFRAQGGGGFPSGPSAQPRVQGAGFRVQGSGFRVQGSGFRVHLSQRSFCSATSSTRSWMSHTSASFLPVSLLVSTICCRERNKKLRALRHPRAQTLGYIEVYDQVADSPRARRAVIRRNLTASYRGTLLIKNRRPLGTYSRTMPRALWGSKGGERFLVSETLLY